MRGTLVNVIAVLLGSTIGLLVGRRLPERLRRVITAGLGLSTLLIGMQMALQAQRLLVVIAGMVLGGVTGELLGIEAALERAGTRLQAWARTGGGTFVAGFVTASLVFCVGPMTVIGSIQEGLTGNAEILYTKSLLDGVASVAFASSLGVGVGFSVLTVVAIQVPLTLLGSRLTFLMLPDVLNALTATGGLLIVGIGLLLLEVKRLPVANFLPALPWAVLVAIGSRWLGW
ncbi:MAG TPA: DUF554 domain-containing protein [Candidatus Sulfotelmatobacter sp.]|nr:DUF554 domain-containing protein [Candidatus Sulfotelmatobacter sp.]